MGADDQEHLGDQLRRQAAIWGHAAEVQAVLARQLRDRSPRGHRT